jgi:hypothetical protein
LHERNETNFIFRISEDARDRTKRSKKHIFKNIYTLHFLSAKRARINRNHHHLLIIALLLLFFFFYRSLLSSSSKEEEKRTRLVDFVSTTREKIERCFLRAFSSLLLARVRVRVKEEENCISRFAPIRGTRVS